MLYKIEWISVAVVAIAVTVVAVTVTAFLVLTVLHLHLPSKVLLLFQLAHARAEAILAEHAVDA
jgi:hypothetical protein